MVRTFRYKAELMSETIRHGDGRVELNEAALAEIESSPLFNEDLAPVPVAKRTWTTYNYAALWISMAHCIPTYMMASGLISAGMNWWQAITILLGNVIGLRRYSLTRIRYEVRHSVSVFARAAYGTIGSNLPSLMRAIVACAGRNSGLDRRPGFTDIFASIIPCWATLLGGPIADIRSRSGCPFCCSGVNIAIIYKGMDLLRLFENWRLPMFLVMTACFSPGYSIKPAELVSFCTSRQFRRLPNSFPILSRA